MAIEETSQLHAAGTYTDEGMERITAQLDTLHSYIADGRLAEVTDLPAEQMRGWIEEQLFILRESLRELDQLGVTSPNPRASLSL